MAKLHGLPAESFADGLAVFWGLSEELKQRFFDIAIGYNRYPQVLYNTEKSGCKEKVGTSSVENIKSESGQFLLNGRHIVAGRGIVGKRQQYLA